MTGYTETIRRWAADTRHAGILSDADGTGEVGLDAQEAGTRLAVRFTLRVEDQRVIDARYQVFGCGYSMAACAVAADLAVGTPLGELPAIDAGRITSLLEGLPEERGYCAALAAEALRAAVKSLANDSKPVAAGFNPQPDHGPLVTTDDPVYAALIGSPAPEGVVEEDRHLFACLLAVAARERYPTAAALGMPENELAAIVQTFFPLSERGVVRSFELPGSELPPEPNEDVAAILFSYLPARGSSEDRQLATWLAYVIAARAAHPGHLWVAMGLHRRPELSAAIRRHLPAMAVANSGNMRWKRFLYKQVCDLGGGMTCKSPNCGVCSDHVLCFAPDGE